MKIAVTGHSAGIGKALAKLLEQRGHEIVGLSKRYGHNIHNISKIADLIEPCDIFVNNAQSHFAQTDLFIAVWRKWRGKDKKIINISTEMVYMEPAPREEWDEYLIQKKTLEHATQMLSMRDKLPKLHIIRPGSIATQPGQTQPEYLDVNEYARSIVSQIDGQ
jgi:nucleoside-diphosphate-sugar epimerase